MQINYKHVILSVLLSIWTTAGWGQTPESQVNENWTLTGNESSESKIYVARDQIILKADGTTNFKFSATDYGQTFTAKIDAGLLFPPTTNTYADANGNIVTDPTQGAVVGSIQGTASVTPTGAAMYQIPINIPAGINGMQPSLSLAYNSQGGFGALGTGWDVAGCSAITRGNKSIYFDGQNNTIKFDNTDALYLDGQRLIYLSGGNGNLTAGATYATEVENYARITYTGTGFILTTNDGKVMEYGATSDSKISAEPRRGTFIDMTWKLNKATDANGNSAIYTYTSDGFYLNEIDYAGQSVIFNYIENTVNPRVSSFNISYSYSSCLLKLNYNKLLNTITIKSGATTLKTYGFTYTADNRLQTVNEIASDNSKVKSTTINWGADNNTVQFNQIGTITDTGLSSQPEGHSSMSYADINGDGYADRIETWVGGSGNNGHITVYFYDSINKTFGNAQSASITITGNDYNTYHQQFIFADINNDGKAEIIFTNSNQLCALKYIPDNRSYSFYPCFSSQLQVGAVGVYTNNYIGDYYDNKIVKLIATDVNHDGYTDIVMAYYNKGSNGHRGYAVFFGSSNGLNTTPASSDLNSEDTFKNIEIGDFNADGKLDILCINSNLTSPQQTVIDDSNVTLTYNYNWKIDDISGTKDQVLDLNGDGMSDLIALCPTNNIWRSSTNTGGLFNSPTWKNEPFSGPNVHFVDINGDGLVDAVNYTNNYDCNNVPNPNYDGYNPAEPEFICIPYYVNTTWNIYLNTGSNNPDSQFSTTPITYTSDNVEMKEPNLISVSDINGDGIADLIITQGANMYALTMPNANRRNLVTSITNGMNQTESFTYKNFSVYDAYTSSEATAKVRPLRAPLLVVDTYTQPDGNVTVYDYTSPKYHTEGKGFLGFSTVTAVNTLRNIKSVSNYDYDPTYYGMNLINQNVTTADGNTPISTSTQTNGHITIDAARKRYIPIVTEQKTTDELKGVEQKTVTDYSQYPNSLTQTATARVKNSETVDLTTVVTTTFTGPNGVTPYLPHSVTTTRTQGTESDTQIKSYDYEFNSDPSKKYQIIKTTETINPDKEAYKVVTETINPDAWGHMQTVTVKAKNQAGTEVSRGSSVSYTGSGRFVASKTDNMGVVTTYDWGDEVYGQLKSETTTIGGKTRTTTYSYNSRGELLETRYPDGNRKTSVVQWAGTGAPAGAVYNSYSQSSGTAPVTVWYDALGREIQKDSYGLNNRKIIVTTEYNTDGVDKGKIHRVSEPHFEGDTFNWAATYSYNATYGFAEDVTTPVGITHTTIDKLTTTVKTPEGTTITVTNAAGQTLSSTVNDKTVNYAYYPNGLIKSSTPYGGQALTMKYNPQGKRTLLMDPDGGTTRNEYNGWGEMTKEVQLIHMNQDSIVTINYYDDFGRLTSINRNNEITTYTYDTNNKSRVNSIAIANKNTQTFGFDDLDRVTSVTEDITLNGTTKTFISGKEYDALGRIKKEIYPSGYYTVNTYDRYSNLTETKDQYNRSIRKANTENALGQATSIFKGSKESTYDYDPVNHQITSVYSNGIIDYTYGYYAADGTNHANNLEWRTDGITNQTENFTYDLQNRLTHWDVTRNGQTTYNSMSFDDVTGNITSKSDIGYTLNYGGKNPNGSTTGRPDATNSAIGPHALSTIAGFPANFPTAELNVTYTDFKKIKTLTEGNKYYELNYGVDDQRRISVYKEGGVTKLTRYYVGNYEEEVSPNGNIRKIHYLSGAILIQNNGIDSLLYTYSDAQGSLIALTDANGGIVRKYAYDPWGKRRDASNWNVADNGVKLIINRGYTGHEHIDAFGIINMNGRVYDPLTAMFFSPDPTLTDAGNWLDYNRYSYCLNNPFRYTDPSGYTWWAENWQPVLTTAASLVVGIGVGILAAPLGVVVTGMLAGAAGGFTSGAVGTALQGDSFNNVMGAGIKGAVIGGIAGMVGGAAADGMTGLIGSSFGGFEAGASIGVAGGAAGGFVGGSLNAWMGGASFGDGLLAGLKGAGIGALAGGLIGGVVGGINSLTHNGNFWNGDGFTSEFSVSELENLTGESADNIPVEYNNESLSEYEEYFNPEGVGNQYADGTIPPGYEKSGDAFVRQQSWTDKLFSGEARPAAATTRFNIKTHLSDVYFSKAAFSSRIKLFLSMQHEYVHCSVNFHYSNPNNTANERAAYDITNRQGIQWGYKSIRDWIDLNYPPSHYLPTYPVNTTNTIRIVRPW